MPELQPGDCRDACISSYYDGDGPDGGFYVETTPRARKKHHCCECRDVIPIGTVHEKVVGKWEGDLATWRTCTSCAEIRKAFCCDGWLFTRLWEDAAESLFPRMTMGCLDKLTTAAAKEKLTAEWRRWLFRHEPDPTLSAQA